MVHGGALSLRPPERSKHSGVAGHIWDFVVTMAKGVFNMRTGETATELGLYMTGCCDEELIFDAGDVFSRCPGCRSLCGWELTDPITSFDELDSLSSGVLRIKLQHPVS